MLLTVQEAADLVGVDPETIRAWRKRGHLQPIRPRAIPVQFREEDVIRCRRARWPRSREQRFAELARQFETTA